MMTVSFEITLPNYSLGGQQRIVISGPGNRGSFSVSPVQGGSVTLTSGDYAAIAKVIEGLTYLCTGQRT